MSYQNEKEKDVSWMWRWGKMILYSPVIAALVGGSIVVTIVIINNVVLNPVSTAIPEPVSFDNTLIPDVRSTLPSDNLTTPMPAPTLTIPDATSTATPTRTLPPSATAIPATTQQPFDEVAVTPFNEHTDNCDESQDGNAYLFTEK